MRAVCRPRCCLAAGSRSRCRRPTRSPAGATASRGMSTCRALPGCCTCRQGSCACATPSRRTPANGRSVPRGRPAVAFRSSSTSPLKAWRDCRTASTGSTRQATALVQVGPPARGGATCLIVTGVPWRTGWKYAERGFRHIYWDAGSMLAQTLVLAASSGFDPRLWTRFPDGHLARPRRCRRDPGVPGRLVGLGPGEPAIDPGGEAVGGSIGDDPIEFPLVTLAQRAGAMDRLGDPWPAAPQMAGPVPPSDDLDTVILRRGSTRIMDRGATVDGDVFRFALAASLRRATTPQFVAVHAVAASTRSLPLARPRTAGAPRLRPRGDVAGVLGPEPRPRCRVRGDQRDRPRDIDDRGYREAQLEAGIIEGRLHLAAYSLGVGASGMSFLDSEIEPLLGEPLGALLFTCVGVPTYAGRAGGMPGEAGLDRHAPVGRHAAGTRPAVHLTLAAYAGVRRRRGAPPRGARSGPAGRTRRRPRSNPRRSGPSG